jgi:hypothetical protein
VTPSTPGVTLERETVSIQPVSGLAAPVQHVVSEAPVPSLDETLEFVRFCYRRRHVSWPALYDEMCAVAARGAFRGLGYCELIEHGISFSLLDLPRLSTLTERVIAEERMSEEVRGSLGPMSLSVLPAGS